jgi:hypothetical protein
MTIIKESVMSYSQKWNREFHFMEHARKASTKSDYNQLSGDESGIKQSPGTLPVTP